MRPYGVWAIADELRVAAGGAGGLSDDDGGTGLMRGFISQHYVSRFTLCFMEDWHVTVAHL